MKKIKIDQVLVKEIERLQYQVDSRRDIITTMLSSNINVSQQKFEAYQQKYNKYFVQYNKLKNELTNKYIDFPYKSWNLDFGNCELTVQE